MEPQAKGRATPRRTPMTRSPRSPISWRWLSSLCWVWLSSNSRPPLATRALGAHRALSAEPGLATKGNRAKDARTEHERDGSHAACGEGELVDTPAGAPFLVQRRLPYGSETVPLHFQIRARAASVDPLRAPLRDSRLRCCGIGDGMSPDPEAKRS